MFSPSNDRGCSAGGGITGREGPGGLVPGGDVPAVVAGCEGLGSGAIKDLLWRDRIRSPISNDNGTRAMAMRFKLKGAVVHARGASQFLEGGGATWFAKSAHVAHASCVLVMAASCRPVRRYGLRTRATEARMLRHRPAGCRRYEPPAKRLRCASCPLNCSFWIQARTKPRGGVVESGFQKFPRLGST